MLTEVKLLPHRTSGDIYCPFHLPGTAAEAEFERAGYVQEEYLLAGTGELYGPGGVDPRLLRGGLPFVTRALVARPGSAEDFSGVVHLAGIHPFLGAVQWEWISELVLSSGDAYVAVGTGTDRLSRGRSTPDYPVAATPITRWFDSVRYAPLLWPQDDGIRWTVFSDAAALLRARDRPLLADLTIERVYASGWSFLGSFMRTFINEGFHDRLRTVDGRAAIDGYLIGISSPWQGGGYLELSAEEQPAPVGDPRRRLRAIDVPVIEFLSQGEGERNIGPQAPDRDEGPGRHRLYEVAGTTHTDLGVAVERTNLVQLAARGHPYAQRERIPHHGVSDVPLRRLFSATMANLDSWVRHGQAPPSSARLEFDAAQEVARDELGNPRGGVRTVQLELPLARYGRAPAAHAADNDTHFLPMYRVPFTGDQLARLYPGGRAEYLDRADAVIDRMASERWLRTVDRDGYRTAVAAAAGAAFGDDD